MASRTAKKRAAPSKATTPRASAPGGKHRRAGARGYVVFISHSSKETWIAGQMAKEVRALGAEAWVDVSSLRGGDEFYSSIVVAIRGCTEAVVLVSPASVNSSWVSFEIGAVAVQGKRVTPVLNNVAPDETGPLRGLNAIDLNDFDEYLKQLKERIRGQRRGGRR